MYAYLFILLYKSEDIIRTHFKTMLTIVLTTFL